MHILKSINPQVFIHLSKINTATIFTGRDTFGSRKLEAYSVQKVNNWELTHGTAHYYIILISQYCNFILINFLHILEF